MNHFIRKISPSNTNQKENLQIKLKDKIAGGICLHIFAQTSKFMNMYHFVDLHLYQ